MIEKFAGREFLIRKGEARQNFNEYFPGRYGPVTGTGTGTGTGTKTGTVEDF